MLRPRTSAGQVADTRFKVLWRKWAGIRGYGRPGWPPENIEGLAKAYEEPNIERWLARTARWRAMYKGFAGHACHRQTTAQVHRPLRTQGGVGNMDRTLLIKSEGVETPIAQGARILPPGDRKAGDPSRRRGQENLHARRSAARSRTPTR